MRTKAESYKKLKNKCYRRESILKILRENIDGLSRREIAKGLNLEINRITSPVLILIREGKIVEAGTRWDSETERNVVVLYFVSGDQPGL